MADDRPTVNLSSDRPDGTISLYDGYRPTLASGEYRFIIQQTVTLNGRPAKHYYRDQPFEIPGSLAPMTGDQVQARFPPAGGRANYEGRLPHLVLTSRSLPWERLLDTDPALTDAPWLLLLVLSGAEIAQVTRSASQAAGTLLGSPIAATLLPEILWSDDKRKELISVIDLPVDLFLAICPRPADLRYLAHLRAVATEQKVHQPMHADGEFAVLSANRFPARGANAVHVVSLEGWGSLIAGRRAVGNAQRIRMVSLDTWTFTSGEDGADTFGGLMGRLNLDSLSVLPSAAGSTPPSGVGAHVHEALQRGYVPLEMRPEDSDPTFAWYRGPLVASPAESARPLRTIRRADQALVFDRATGVLDISYAAAWQLGRLIALGDATFVHGLREMVRSGHDSAQAARAIARFLEIHHAEIERTGGVAHLVAEWLANLVLLRPVPFHYLVADDRLLPRDAIRFFHIDADWLDALVDGALSVAVHASGDSDQVSSRRELRPIVSRLVARHRRKERGLPARDDDADNVLDQPITGFLLRSSTVMTWPGLEVTIDVDGPHADAILRLDRPTDGVMLCLARGIVQGVTMREPAEGITFGLDDDGGLSLRGTNGKKLTGVRTRLQRPGGSTGVLNMSDLAREAAVTLGVADVSPSTLAYHLIRSPGIQTFEWKARPS